MSKVKYSKYQNEILEMYYNGKNAVEIAEIINAKYGTGLFVRGAIQMQMNKGKQDENEQAKMFSENQERVQNGKNSAQKGAEKQEITQTQEKQEAKKMNESDKVLIQVIESFSRLEEEFHKAFVTSIILNDELGRAIDALKEKRRKNKIKYLLLGGSFLVAMIFGIILGCHDAHTGANMPIFSFDYIKDMWPGVLVGLGLILLLDIVIIIQHKREHN